MSLLVEAMSSPAFYPERPERIERRETHTAYVFLAGEHAYKVKKPVLLPFIDCSTSTKRRALCKHELTINRRLAPDVYLGVVPIVYEGKSYRLSAAPPSNETDYEFAVKMRRLPDERRLDHLIEARAVRIEDIRAIACNVAEFHQRATRRFAWKYGSAASVWELVVGNLRETRELAPDAAAQNQVEEIHQYVRHYVQNHWEFLNLRAHEGRVRDGHGDLRADAVYLTEDGVRIIDALEFSERLRCCDVASEIGFLAMDLERLGRFDYAEELVRAYAEASGDHDTLVLMRFYKCYRAMVRAKVELIRSLQQHPNDRHGVLGDSATQYFELARAYVESPAPQSLIAVCGLSGTGKSTMARILQKELRFEILASDHERKQLAGVHPTARFDTAYKEGIYSEDFTRCVYRSLIDKAETILKSKAGVIIDATFQCREQRAMVADLATRLGVAPIFVECRADQDEVVRRLSLRTQRADEISDATVEVYLSQLREFQPLVEIAPNQHVICASGALQGFGSALLAVERLILFRQLSHGRGSAGAEITLR